VLLENVQATSTSYFAAGVFLAIGTCASAPVPAASLFSGPGGTGACTSLPGGCLLYLDTSTSVFLLQAGSLIGNPYWGVWSLPIPNSSALAGATLCLQAINRPDPAYCWRISNGLSVTILP
jgi:hypothetical protein